MEQQQKLRHVQQLAGRLATLNRFSGKLGENALPFYQLFRKTDKFFWTPKARAAFKDLKRLLSTHLVLVTPHEKEPMLMYIAVTK
jgi:hypothetical protein